ncbi:MAG: hypothetical protein ACRDHY_09900, partial [Anaerolineales bacterium]
MTRADRLLDLADLLRARDETASIEAAEREALPLREAQRRWAELLRRIYEVDPLTCPACGGA